jgi:hypothetical protein
VGKQKHDVGHKKRRKNALAAAARVSRAWTKDFYRGIREDGESQNRRNL